MSDYVTLDGRRVPVSRESLEAMVSEYRTYEPHDSRDVDGAVEAMAHAVDQVLAQRMPEMVQALRVTLGNLRSMAGCHPAVYGEWLASWSARSASSTSPRVASPGARRDPRAGRGPG